MPTQNPYTENLNSVDLPEPANAAPDYKSAQSRDVTLEEWNRTQTRLRLLEDFCIAIKHNLTSAITADIEALGNSIVTEHTDLAGTYLSKTQAADTYLPKDLAAQIYALRPEAGYPTPGTFLYKCINGVVQWVEENVPSTDPEPTPVVTYTITTSVTHGTYTGATTIASNGASAVTITADTGYERPVTVSVTGAQFTYNNNTGVILLSNPTDSVVITAVCTQVQNPQLEFTSNGDGTCYVSGVGTITSHSIVIPSISPAGDAVTKIGTSAFSGNTNIESVTIPNGVITIESNAFYGCTALTSVQVPSTVTRIGGQAFYQCTNLPRISIPEGIERIDSYTFSYCSSLTEIIIPSTVTDIYPGAFYSCTSLTQIICDATTPPTLYDNGALQNTNNCPIYVPDTNLNTYKAAEFWATVQDRICPKNGVYTVTTSVTNGSYIGISTIVFGTTATITIEPNPGYELPTSVSVSGASYNYDSNTGTISISSPTGDVIVSATCPAFVFPTYNITTVVNNGTYTGATTIQQYGTATVTISPSTSYELPETVSVTGATAEYNSTTGTIALSNPTGNVTITATCTLTTSNVVGQAVIGSAIVTGPTYFTYTITTTVTHGVYSGSTSIQQNGTATVTVTPSEGYLLPDTVSVSGATVNYNKTTGQITLSSPTNNITITVACYVPSLAFASNGDGTCYVSGIGTITSPVVVIPSVSPDGDTVRAIGNYAFRGYTSLTDVTIPDSVTSIGADAFNGCSRLTSVTIGNNVTIIGTAAFYNCTCLSSVTISDSVTNIGSQAFSDCNSLTSIVIPNSVINIGASAFQNCTSLASVTIGNSVTSVEASAFHSCTSLTSITIPDSVTSIGYAAFHSCAGLTSITIGNGVTSIGNYVLSGCTSLTSIVVTNENAKYHSAGNCLIETESKKLIAGCKTSIIPNDGSVTSIGNQAFSSCNSLTSITIPDNVTSIGEWAFSSCTGLTNVTIPDSMTSIGYAAFHSCAGLTSITIGNSVTSIGNYAFSGCTGLTSISISTTTPPTLGSADALKNTNNCPIYVPAESVNDYRHATYWAALANRIISARYTITTNITNGTCTGATTIQPNETVTVTLVPDSGYTYPEPETVVVSGATASYNIPTGVFTLSNPTSNVTITATCQPTSNVVGEAVVGYAVVTQSSLSTYTITTNITNGTCTGDSSIQQNGTANLTITAGSDYVRPTSITVTGATFTYDSSTGAVALSSPTGNVTITATCPERTLSFRTDGNNAYVVGMGTYNKTAVVIPATSPNGYTVVGIDDRAFYGCTSITSVTFPNSVTSIGNSAFFGCTSLASVNFGENSQLTSIGESAFCNCIGLTNIVFPNSVTTVDRMAFMYATGLKTVEIGTGISTISFSVFNHCTSLEKVIIHATTPPTLLSNNAFNDTNNCPIFVPAESVTTYQQATNWSALADRIYSTIEYVITTSVTNGTYSGDTSIEQGGTAGVTITPSTGYELPSSVTVTGVANYDYVMGTVYLLNPYDNVTISAVCPAEQEPQQGS